MDLLGIERSFLHDLYIKCYTEGSPTLQEVEHWAKAKNLDLATFRLEYDQLVKNELIHHKQEDGIVYLTPKGTLLTEKRGWAPADLVRENRDMRSRLLHTLAGYLIKVAPNMNVSDLIERTGLVGKYCLGNIELLVSMGYARWLVHNVRLHINSKVCAKDESLSHT